MMDEWMAQIDIMNVAVEQHDEKWRRENENHKCDSWHNYPSGNWTCKHMVMSRNKDEVVREAVNEVHKVNPFGWNEFTQDHPEFKKIFGDVDGK